MSTNFLGPALLTDLLYESLCNAAKTTDSPVRIINVSSISATLHGHVDLTNEDTLNSSSAGTLNPFIQYGVSKLAQVLYSNELNRQWKTSNIQSCSLHPGECQLIYQIWVLVLGVVRTDIYRDATSLLAFQVKMYFGLLGKTAWQGCQTTLHCILTDDDVGGSFYSDCQPMPKPFCHQLMGNEDAERRFFFKVRRMLNLTDSCTNLLKDFIPEKTLNSEWNHSPVNINVVIDTNTFNETCFSAENILWQEFPTFFCNQSNGLHQVCNLKALNFFLVFLNSVASPSVMNQGSWSCTKPGSKMLTFLHFNPCMAPVNFSSSMPISS